MATAGLLALLDDIATVLDDVAVLSKVAAKKTAGVLGDDLALNAQQVSGVRAERELPVVWAVAKGSAKNKLVLVPAALLLSLFLPWIITPLLILGGSFLCFEGFEKIAHRFLHPAESKDHASQLIEKWRQPDFDIVAFEKEKIAGAIRTDFILSAEIVVIALGIVKESDLLQQIVVLVLIAAAMTVFVYGLVAVIVKLDDVGAFLTRRTGDRIGDSLQRSFGRGLLMLCPWLMKGLSFAGTIAMFLVGGGIVVHGLPFLHGLLHTVQHRVAKAGLPEVFSEALFNGLVGLLLGALIVTIVTLLRSGFERRSPPVS